jgi:hypothetical protein
MNKKKKDRRIWPNQKDLIIENLNLKCPSPSLGCPVPLSSVYGVFWVFGNLGLCGNQSDKFPSKLRVLLNRKTLSGP